MPKMYFWFISVPLPCIVSNWSAWSAVDATGGSSRVRYVVRININGGTACPNLIESKKGIDFKIFL